MKELDVAEQVARTVLEAVEKERDVDFEKARAEIAYAEAQTTEPETPADDGVKHLNAEAVVVSLAGIRADLKTALRVGTHKDLRAVAKGVVAYIDGVLSTD